MLHISELAIESEINSTECSMHDVSSFLEFPHFQMNGAVCADAFDFWWRAVEAADGVQLVGSHLSSKYEQPSLYFAHYLVTRPGERVRQMK